MKCYTYVSVLRFCNILPEINLCISCESFLGMGFWDFFPSQLSVSKEFKFSVITLFINYFYVFFRRSRFSNLICETDWILKQWMQCYFWNQICNFLTVRSLLYCKWGFHANFSFNFQCEQFRKFVFCIQEIIKRKIKISKFFYKKF